MHFYEREHGWNQSNFILPVLNVAYDCGKQRLNEKCENQDYLKTFKL